MNMIKEQKEIVDLCDSEIERCRNVLESKSIGFDDVMFYRGRIDAMRFIKKSLLKDNDTIEVTSGDYYE